MLSAPPAAETKATDFPPRKHRGSDRRAGQYRTGRGAPRPSIGRNASPIRVAAPARRRIERHQRRRAVQWCRRLVTHRGMTHLSRASARRGRCLLIRCRCLLQAKLPWHGCLQRTSLSRTSIVASDLTVSRKCCGDETSVMFDRFAVFAGLQSFLRKTLRNCQWRARAAGGNRHPAGCSYGRCLILRHPD
jgi:hypothetical protein